MNIYQYLDAVKKGRPINAHRFKKLLQNEGLKLEDVGKISHVKSEKYAVNISNTELFENWMHRFAPSKSRVDASTRLGDSHLHSTSATYLIAKQGEENSPDFVIKCSHESSNEAVNSDWKDKTAILIENSECYTQSSAFLAHLGITDTHHKLVIWSAGNAVTHPLTVSLLTKFKHLLYCPDYDLAGIEIYETLSKTLGEKITFVMPDNLEDYSSQCRRPKVEIHYIKALEKAQKHGFTPMIALLRKGMGVLEQEVIIRGKI